jgi:hypothetical protein
MLALWSFLRIVGKRATGWEPIVGLLAITAAIHFHYQAVVVVPFALTVMIYSWFRHPQLRKKWLWGIFWSLLTIVPYFLVESRHHWQNTRAIISYFTEEHSRYFASVSKPAYVLSFIPAFFERVMIHQELPRHWLGLLLLWYGFWRLSLTALKKRKLHGWMWWYLVSILIMLRVYKGDKVDYYLSTLYLAPSLFLAYIWQRQKWLGYGLLVFMLFIIGRFYGQTIRVDQYHDLVAASKFITKELSSRPARFIFHNNDDINTYVYGLEKYGELNIDQRSSLIVDICDPRKTCAWDGRLTCDVSRSYTYSAALKSAGKYSELIRFITGEGQTILIGELNEQPAASYYPLYTEGFVYGSDALRPEIYR